MKQVSKKINVDKLEKQSIMKSSTEAIVLKRSTEESEYIMAKNTKATTIAIAAGVAASTENKEVITAATETAAAPAAAPAAEVVAAPAATAEVIQSAAPAAVSKASIANAIFKQMFGMQQVPARKDMIKAAMTQAGLTEKGAATYLQNYKTKNGLVKKSTATA